MDTDKHANARGDMQKRLYNSTLILARSERCLGQVRGLLEMTYVRLSIIQ